MIHRRLSLDLPDYSKQRQSGHHKLSLLHGGTYMKQKRSIPYKYFLKSFPHRPCNSEPSSPQRISLHS